MATKKTETTKKKGTATKKTSIKATKVEKELDVKDVVVEEAVKLDEAQKDNTVHEGELPIDVAPNNEVLETEVKVEHFEEIPKTEETQSVEVVETSETESVDVVEPTKPEENEAVTEETAENLDDAPKVEDVKKEPTMKDRIKKVLGILGKNTASEINKQRKAGYKWLSY